MSQFDNEVMWKWVNVVYNFEPETLNLEPKTLQT